MATQQVAVVQQSNQAAVLAPVSQGAVQYAVAQAGTQVTPQLQGQAGSTGKTKKISVITIE